MEEGLITKNVRIIIMQFTAEIIERRLKTYPDFQYYKLHIEKINANLELNPDIAIETCKSLLEGICKKILQDFDPSYSKKEVDNFDLSVLCKKAIEKLSEFTNHEIEFSQRACSLIHIIGDLRNQRGDISHGRASPKELSSCIDESTLIARLTDPIATYLLECYFFIKETYLKEIQYDDNPTFNEFLDDKYPMEGILLYSKALYEQDFDAYCAELDRFLYNE